MEAAQKKVMELQRQLDELKQASVQQKTELDLKTKVSQQQDKELSQLKKAEERLTKAADEAKIKEQSSEQRSQSLAKELAEHRKKLAELEKKALGDVEVIQNQTKAAASLRNQLAEAQQEAQVQKRQLGQLESKGEVARQDLEQLEKLLISSGKAERGISVETITDRLKVGIECLQAEAAQSRNHLQQMIEAIKKSDRPKKRIRPVDPSKEEKAEPVQGGVPIGELITDLKAKIENLLVKSQGQKKEITYLSTVFTHFFFLLAQNGLTSLTTLIKAKVGWEGIPEPTEIDKELEKFQNFSSALSKTEMEEIGESVKAVLANLEQEESRAREEAKNISARAIDEKATAAGVGSPILLSQSATRGSRPSVVEERKLTPAESPACRIS